METKKIEEKIEVMKTLLKDQYFSIDWVMKTLGLEKDVNIVRKDKMDKIRNE